MKLKTCFLPLLCLFLQAKAQENIIPKGLQPGDQVPDLPLSPITNYNTTQAHLHDFKGQLLILDFWATWCSPCIAMLPKMEALQQQYQGRVLFLPIAYQDQHTVDAFLTKFRHGKATNLPEITGDEALGKLFPHTYLPHYVWIDGTGKVAAITEYTAVTAAGIDTVLSGQRLRSGTKADVRIRYDRNQPLLAGGNGGDGHNLLYHSLLTGRTEGLHGGYEVTEPDTLRGRKLTIRNLTLPDIFKIAWGAGETWFGPNRILIDVADKSLLVRPEGAPETAWYKEHTWCYELIVPASLQDQLYPMMQRDLALCFNQYRVKVENRPMKCLLLVRTSKTDKLKSRGGESLSNFSALGCTLQNFPLNRLVSELDVVFMQKSPLPVIDDTGYDAWVDLTLDANLTDKDAVNRELDRYYLQLKEGVKDIPMLIIQDQAKP